MEQNNKNITQNVLPEIRLFDPVARLCKIAHFLFDHIQAPGLSDHNRGGGPALDRALFDEREE